MTLPTIDHTHDRELVSWVASAQRHPDFPIQNLPLGIFAPRGADAGAGAAFRPGCAIGDAILDLRALSGAGLLPAACARLVDGSTLNALMGAPPPVRLALRHRLSALLSDPNQSSAIAPFLHPADGCDLALPARIGDYTDFYAGIHHAETVGRLFRPEAPLLPNYKHVPIGYHGRASSVRPSGEAVVRPNGQSRSANDTAPSFGPSARLDYELELGLWVGQANRLGVPIPIDEASTHIVGYSLLNDWSARDLQAWEYQPLGPFLAKSFHTTVSPWVVTLEALAPFLVAQPSRPEGDPKPLPYLRAAEDQARGALALELEVWLSTPAMRQAGQAPHRLAVSDARHMYWTFAQLLTHHASNGCALQPGDLLGSGTISGPQTSGAGSLLEATLGGSSPILLPNGEQRTFLQDGDEIGLTARAHAEGFVSLGFGPCRARVAPAP